MSKQYFISAIKLDATREHIEYVKVRKADTTDHYIIPRAFVALLIESGLSFKTRFCHNGTWHTGAEVEIFEYVYLRANPNSTARDNLRNLQEMR